MLVAAALALQVKVLSWIVAAVCNAYMGQWEPGQDVRGVKLLRRLDITIITSGIEVVLCYSLGLLGVFLIYKEWRQGKLNYPPT
ncbi:hypothetical protein J5I95_21330 [Candidatus Poribacteria bacterium]|nr:hypothetical protein [Candidatus Poribacteria bacterium]